MNFLRAIHPRWLLGLLLLAGVAGFTGCSSTEPENLSARPWNTPNGYENGLPAGMMQGH